MFKCKALYIQSPLHACASCMTGERASQGCGRRRRLRWRWEIAKLTHWFAVGYGGLTSVMIVVMIMVMMMMMMMMMVMVVATSTTTKVTLLRAIF